MSAVSSDRNSGMMTMNSIGIKTTLLEVVAEKKKKIKETEDLRLPSLNQFYLLKISNFKNTLCTSDQ